MVKFLVTHLATACITQFEEHWSKESEVDLPNSHFPLSAVTEPSPGV